MKAAIKGETQKHPADLTPNENLEVCQNYGSPAEEVLSTTKYTSGLIPKQENVIRKSSSQQDIDIWISRIVVIFCSLMLVGAGFIAIESEYHWGMTKYGRVVELYDKKAVGIGIFFISFAVMFLTAIVNRKLAGWLGLLGVFGIAFGIWISFRN